MQTSPGRRKLEGAFQGWGEALVTSTEVDSHNHGLRDLGLRAFAKRWLWMCHHTSEDTFLVHQCPPGEDAIEAGVHALIIGMSTYPPRPKSLDWIRHPQLPFGDIDGAALGAAQFAQFLADKFGHPAGIPVRTLRLLLLPTQEEEGHLPVASRMWNDASFDNVDAAIWGWYRDCDSHPDNVALMYISGHGIVLPHSVPIVFLGRANQEKNPCAQSINLTAIREAMAYNMARDNIYFFDCCAVKDTAAAFPYDCINQSGITLPILTEGRQPRSNCVAVRSTRTGTESYTISASEGTLFSHTLLPLLWTAGSLIQDLFTITTDRLKDRLREEFQAIPDAEGQEPDVEGHMPGGIHRPEPPPNFKIRFYADGGTESQFRLIVYNNSDHPVIDETVFEGRVVNLPAGKYNYRVETESVNAGIPRSFDLDRNMAVDIERGYVVWA
ncbi:caspase family protein [Streptomyces sp. NPDC023588]|uniref:caspase family protein n=1 Tax=Streptomyces sp. NPDC023588 TaxID=3154907 RepID=UPI0033DE8F44